jgi:hypothetical protein
VLLLLLLALLLLQLALNRRFDFLHSTNIPPSKKK